MIDIYGTATCSFCLRAKKLCERMGLKYEYKDIGYEKYKNELDGLLTEGYRTVPQIFRYGKLIGGYTEFAAELENTSGGFGDGKL
jgi:glutaredoxin 1